MIEGEWDVTKGTVKKFTKALIEEIKNKRASRKGATNMAEKEKTGINAAEIEDWKFAHDEKLESYVIPENIVRIGKCAFAHCKKLKKIEIGSNVAIIGKYAFRKDNRPGGMAEFTEVVNRSIQPQAIEAGHFLNCDLSKTVLLVPAQSIDEYKNADCWEDFGEIRALEAASSENSINKDELIFNFPEISHSVHIWLGNFESEQKFEEYADNSEYECEYYGHLLGEDNFDESPDEQGILCGFCSEYRIFRQEAADIVDDLLWDYSETDLSPGDFLAKFLEGIPISPEVVLEACTKKFPKLKKANSMIFVFGWKNKADDFMKNKSTMNYLGEFEMEEPEPDTDGPYEGAD